MIIRLSIGILAGIFIYRIIRTIKENNEIEKEYEREGLEFEERQSRNKGEF